MTQQLHITIEGKLGQIPFNTLATMARNSCDILEELDNAVSAKPGGTMEWFVSGISTEASLTVVIESKSKLRDVDYSGKVTELFVDGLAHIQKEHTTPPYFSDYGLRKTHSIAKTLRKNGAKAIRVEDIERKASGLIKADVADSLKKLISIRYQEIGVRALVPVYGQRTNASVSQVCVLEPLKHGSIAFSRAGDEPAHFHGGQGTGAGS